MSTVSRAAALIARFEELVPVDEAKRAPSFRQFHSRSEKALNDTTSSTSDEGRAINYTVALLKALGFENDGGDWYDEHLHPESDAEVSIQHGGYDGSQPTVTVFGRNFKGEFNRTFSLNDDGAEELYNFLKASAEKPALTEELAPISEDIMAAARKALDIRKQPKDVVELADVRVGTSFYTDDGAFHVHRYASNFTITDIADGYRVGKQCPQIVIMNRFGQDPAAMRTFLMDQKNQGVTGLYGLFDKYVQDADVGDIKVLVREVKAKEVFNPLRLGHIKPLTKLPKRFGNDQLIKAIANGQYDVLSQNFRYTDDYAGDAANNFGRGELNPIAQLEDLITKRAAVQFSTDRGDGIVEVTYGAHSNDSRKCMVNLEAKH